MVKRLLLIRTAAARDDLLEAAFQRAVQNGIFGDFGAKGKPKTGGTSLSTSVELLNRHADGLSEASSGRCLIHLQR